MITGFNPSVSNNRNQNLKFGNIRTASKTKDALIFAMCDKHPAKRITREQAFQRLDEAIQKEDTIGKKILQLLKEQMLRDKTN